LSRLRGIDGATVLPEFAELSLTTAGPGGGIGSPFPGPPMACRRRVLRRPRQPLPLWSIARLSPVFGSCKRIAAANGDLLVHWADRFATRRVSPMCSAISSRRCDKTLGTCLGARRIDAAQERA